MSFLFGLHNNIYRDEAGSDGDGGGGGGGNDDKDLDGGAGDGGGGGDKGGQGGVNNALSGGGDGDDNKGAWPTDWRQRSASAYVGATEGEAFDKEVKRLERYDSPSEVWKSTRELEKRFSSGDTIRKLPENATDEQIAEYRKELGIPDKKEGYYDGFGELTIGDADKPIMDDFLENVALKENMNPATAKAFATWFQEFRTASNEIQAEEDKVQANETTELLRDEWGPDYRPNINTVANFMSRAPEELRNKLESARFEDGKALFNDPHFIRWIHSVETTINPASSYVPPGGTSDEKGMQSRLAELNKYMSEKPDEWFKDEAAQKEWRTLTEAVDQMEKRKAG